MNVIKFDIEIKKINREYLYQFWREKANDIPIKEVIKTELKSVSSSSGDYFETLLKTWDDIEYPNVGNLNSSSYLLGYFTVNNSKIFLFELKSSGITGMNNIPLQIYAIGSLPIEDILNESFTQIKKILKNLECNLIDKSVIHIFPYNSSQKDIESAELKIKANLSSIITYKAKDLIRLFLVFIFSLGCIFYALSLDPGDDFRVVFRALFGSGLFYIFIDLVISIIVPWLTSRHKKRVTIDNLSSVVEKTTLNDVIGKTETLVIPKEQ